MWIRSTIFEKNSYVDDGITDTGAYERKAIMTP